MVNSGETACENSFKIALKLRRFLLSVAQVKNEEEGEVYYDQNGCEKDETESIENASSQNPVALDRCFVSLPRSCLVFDQRLLPQNITDVYQNRIGQRSGLHQFGLEMGGKTLVYDFFHVVFRYVVVGRRRSFHVPQ